MKKEYFLLGAIVILVVVVISSVVFCRRSKASLKIFGTYIGRCSVCNCLYQIPSHQICIFRQGGTPTCFLCPQCRQNKD